MCTHGLRRGAAKCCALAYRDTLIGVYCLMCSRMWAYSFYVWDRAEMTLRLVALVPGGSWHLHALKLGFVVGCALVAAAVRSDAGVMTAANQPRLAAHYPPSRVALAVAATGGAAAKFCITWQLVRPPRTHHCRECDRCVFKFDHHCGWMNNCIGYKNLRLFVLFICFRSILCGYGLLFIAALLTQLYRTVRSGGDAVLIGEPPPAMTPERLTRLVAMARGKQPLYNDGFRCAQPGAASHGNARLADGEGHASPRQLAAAARKPTPRRAARLGHGVLAKAARDGRARDRDRRL